MIRYALLISVFIYTIFILLLNAEPAEQSSYIYRVTNRKYISHLLFQIIAGQNTITFLTTHPRYDAFKSVPHHLYYPCGDASACVREIRKLDKHLQSGKNLGLLLDGSTILRIDYELQNSRDRTE